MFSPPAVGVDQTSVALPRRYGAYIIDMLPSLIVVPVIIIGFFSLSTTRTVADSVSYCEVVQARATPTLCIENGDTEVRILKGGELAELIAIGSGVALLIAANQWLLQGLTGASVGKHI